MAIPISTLLAGERGRTKEPLTIPIDYNDGTAVDPPAGTVFTTQKEVDDFLAANSTTNFKHLTAVWAASPTIISHDVTFSCASGVHRPRNPEPLAVGRFATVAYVLTGKLFIGDATMNINGSTTLTPESGLTGLTVTAEQLGSDDPYVDVSGTPFAAMDLRGLYVSFSGGTQQLIRAHTDSRLNLTRNIPVSVLGETLTVGRPSTIFRNSYDDVSSTPYTSFMRFGNTGQIFLTFTPLFTEIATGSIRVRDLSYQPFGAFDCAACEQRDTISYIRCLFDYKHQNALFGVTSIGSGIFYFPLSFGVVWEISFIGQPSSVTGLFLFGDEITVYYSAFRGLSTGIWNGAKSTMRSPQFLDNTGTSVRVVRGGSVEIFGKSSLGGAFATIDGGAVGIDITENGILSGTVSVPINNTTTAAVRVTADGRWDTFSSGTITGSNSGVGVDITGSGAYVNFRPGIAVTGTGGDVRINGTVLSYADITAAPNSTVLSNGNIVVR